MSPVRRQPSAALALDRDHVVQVLADHRQSLRTFLAGFAATRAQIDALERDLWAQWISRPQAETAIGQRAGLQVLAATALARHLDAGAATAIAIQDPLGYLLAQTGREALQSGVDAPGGAGRIQVGIARLDPEQRDLILGRYQGGLGNAALATQRGWDRAQVDAGLVVARAAIDQPQPPSPGASVQRQESVMTALIEDFLAGVIDPDSRSLLAQRVRDDLPFAARFERQVRIDLLLGEALGEPSMATMTAFADEILAAAAAPALRATSADSHRSAAVDSRRSARIPSQRLRRRLPSPVLGATVAVGAVIAVIVAVMLKPPGNPGRHDSTQPTSAHAAPGAPRADRPLPAQPSPAAPIVAQPPALPAPREASETALHASRSAALAVPEAVATPPVPPADGAAPAAPVIAATLTPPDVTVPVTLGEQLPAPAAPPVAATAPAFLKGIDLGGEAVIIEGGRWQSQKLAEADGMTLTNARRVSVSLALIPPPPDADTRAMLSSGISTARSDLLALSFKLPDGGYEVTFWTAENQRAHARVFDLTCGGVVISGLGDLPLGGWAKCGPIAVEVRNQQLDIVAKALRGAPVLMGIAISRTTAAKSYVADFSAGVAKDWTPLGGTWSCAEGKYNHTSAEGLDLCVYDALTLKDLAFTVSMMPRFDNVAGLVFGFTDAQDYDALTIDGLGSVALARVAKGMRTQVAQAACVGTGKWKTSTVTVTRIGRKVTVAINGAAIITAADLGEPVEGKVGLLTHFNPVDFSAITIGLPPR